MRPAKIASSCEPLGALDLSRPVTVEWLDGEGTAIRMAWSCAERGKPQRLTKRNGGNQQVEVPSESGTRDNTLSMRINPWNQTSAPTNGPSMFELPRAGLDHGPVVGPHREGASIIHPAEVLSRRMGRALAGQRGHRLLVGWV